MKNVNIAKKSNIKCEHCEFFNCDNAKAISECTNKDSKKYGKVNYWNRCKCFKWEKSILEANLPAVERETLLSATDVRDYRIKHIPSNMFTFYILKAKKVDDEYSEYDICVHLVNHPMNCMKLSTVTVKSFEEAEIELDKMIRLYGNTEQTYTNRKET